MSAREDSLSVDQTDSRNEPVTSARVDRMMTLFRSATAVEMAFAAGRRSNGAHGAKDVQSADGAKALHGGGPNHEPAATSNWGRRIMGRRCPGCFVAFHHGANGQIRGA
jgi:hypothetical protein